MRLRSDTPLRSGARPRPERDASETYDKLLHERMVTEETLAYPLFHPRSRRQMPISVSRTEFAAEFPGEGELVEFKRGTGREALQSSAVAFSNAKGGVILIGVEDDGSITGRSMDGGTLDAIHTALRDAHDLGRYEIASVDIEGTPVVVISIAHREQGFAQSSNGRVLVRRGTQDLALFGAELQRVINERSFARFESAVTDIPFEDVDQEASERLRRAYGWSLDSTPVRLSDVGLLSGGKLTVAGALHLLADPASTLGKAYVEVLRYPDDATPDYDRRDEVRGPLARQVEAGIRLVMEHLGSDLVVLGARRFELPRIPEVVVREALVNALAHRSYEHNGTPVRVELRPGWVMIASPGGLPEPVTVGNMRETTAARNLDVIRALRRLGLAEDAGRGVDVMQDTMRSEMFDQPEFRDPGHSVEVVLPTHSSVAPVERAWVRELEARGDLRPADRGVLVHAARGEPLTNAVVRRLAQVDSREARMILKRLRDHGLLRQHGERGGATYTLFEDLRPPAGLRLGPEELAALVEQLAADGPVSNADVRAATGLDRTDALRLLDRLVSEGRLVRTGARRGTRYHRPEGEPVNRER